MARNNQINVKFTAEEIEKVRRRASNLDMNINEYVRLTCLNSQIKVECVRAILH